MAIDQTVVEVGPLFTTVFLPGVPAFAGGGASVPSVQKAGGALKQFVGPIYQAVLLLHPVHFVPSGGVGPFG